MSPGAAPTPPVPLFPHGCHPLRPPCDRPHRPAAAAAPCPPPPLRPSAAASGCSRAVSPAPPFALFPSVDLCDEELVFPMAADDGATAAAPPLVLPRDPPPSQAALLPWMQAADPRAILHVLRSDGQPVSVFEFPRKWVGLAGAGA